MTISRQKIPIAVTIAGSDPSGGAGIQADLKTFSALDVYGASVITVLTAQNTLGVQATHTLPYQFVRAQMQSVFSDLDVQAVKVGMIGEAKLIETVAEELDKWCKVPVVLDPVMVATSGDPLLAKGAETALVDLLFPRSALITPNLQESARLLSSPIAQTEDEMRDQAKLLLDRGANSVLIKGGHGNGDQAIDIYADRVKTEKFASPRIHTKNIHGTGCTLSSAIAAGLAKGQDLHEAIKNAKTYLTDAIKHAAELNIGKGPGPVHHFHRR